MQIEPLTARVHGFDINAAYEMARLVHEERIREGASPVGRKIGCTNREMWRASERADVWLIHPSTAAGLYCGRLPSLKGLDLFETEGA